MVDSRYARMGHPALLGKLLERLLNAQILLLQGLDD